MHPTEPVASPAAGPTPPRVPARARTGLARVTVAAAAVIGLATPRPASAETYARCARAHRWTIEERVTVGVRVVRVRKSWAVGPAVSVGRYRDPTRWTITCGAPEPWDTTGYYEPERIDGVGVWAIFGEAIDWMAGVDGTIGREDGLGRTALDFQGSAGLVASPDTLSVSVAGHAGIAPVFLGVRWPERTALIAHAPQVSYGVRLAVPVVGGPGPLTLLQEGAVSAAASAGTVWRARLW